MSYELIVTEKPSQAKKIAESLADTTPTKKSEDGVPYYIITHNKKNIILASAVGHVYSLTEREKSYNYPSYDIHWKEAYSVDKNAGHTRKYIKVIKNLAKNANEFTVATDFDVEGEVIGLNLIRFACKQKDANRMKFSTLTKPDLIEAYAKKQSHLEWGQANAGETRHFLDWMYGINISRALSQAIRKAGLFKQLSSGRVQGPALKLIVDKEKEIRAFVPTPYWQITYAGNVQDALLEANHEQDKFIDEQKAKVIFEKIHGKDGLISNIEKSETKSQPPTPFDLTTLQTESFRSLKIPPKDTLAIAQELYTKGFTSYPRTSSQELPPELGYRKLLEALLRNSHYTSLAEKILSLKTLKPNNGKKKDPAHPAIYPTGIVPDYDSLNSREIKIYDLIVRRFLATFADAAVRETNKIIISVQEEPFIAKGTRTIYKGWFEFYGSHVKLEEQEVPKVEIGNDVKHKHSELLKKETKPPKRFTPASLIKELEKRNLGTKSTRAAIIDTLYQRGYVLEKSLEPTEIGIKTTDTLEKYCPDIVHEDLTRQFEDEMDLIRENKSTEEKVLAIAKQELTKILGSLKEKEKGIGLELKESLFESQEKENTLGTCPKCNEGTLMIKYSPRTKQHFVGCSAYPDCNAVFGLPGNGKDVRSTNKTCEACNFPMIEAGSGRNKRVVCFNMECPIKKEQEQEALDPKVKELISKPCPNCSSELAIRKSIYGEFVGCTNYPKCRYTAKLDGTVTNDGTRMPASKKNAVAKKKTTKKTATKKTTKKTAKKATSKK